MLVGKRRHCLFLTCSGVTCGGRTYRGDAWGHPSPHVPCRAAHPRTHARTDTHAPRSRWLCGVLGPEHCRAAPGPRRTSCPALGSGTRVSPRKCCRAFPETNTRPCAPQVSEAFGGEDACARGCKTPPAVSFDGYFPKCSEGFLCEPFCFWSVGLLCLSVAVRTTRAPLRFPLGPPARPSRA